MDWITGDLVRTLVERVWPIYAGGDGVTIQLLPRAETCPVRGMVLWDADGDRWHVLADAALAPRALLRLLGHELGHIAAGDLEPGGTPDLDAQRAMFEGRGGMRRVTTAARWMGQRVRPDVVAEEEKANAFADRFLERWWPVLEAAERSAVLALRQFRQKGA